MILAGIAINQGGRVVGTCTIRTNHLFAQTALQVNQQRFIKIQVTHIQHLNFKPET
jgi:hypothetical protein